MANTRTLRVCSQCYSAECQVTAWVRVNGDTIVDGDGPTDGVWCPTCESHDTDLVDVSIGHCVVVKPEARSEVGFVGPLRGQILSFGMLGSDPDERDALISHPKDGKRLNLARHVPLRLLRLVEGD